MKRLHGSAYKSFTFSVALGAVGCVCRFADALEPPYFTWGAGIGQTGPYPQIPHVEINELFQPTQAGVSAYHHGFYIVQWNQEIVIMAFTQDYGEGLGGAYVSWIRSTDESLGSSWTEFAPLFDPQDNVAVVADSVQRVVSPVKFITFGDLLFAVAAVADRDWLHGGASIFHGLMAREIMPDWTLGDQFWITDDPVIPTAGFPSYPYDGFSASILLPAVDAIDLNVPINLNDGEGGQLVEPSRIRLFHDTILILWRRAPYVAASQNKWGQLSIDGGATWGLPALTNVPDDPSLTTLLVLDTGQIIVIGNPKPRSGHALRNPLYIGSARHPSTGDEQVVFDKVWTLFDQDVNAPIFAGRNKSGGPQYPAAIQLADRRLAVVFDTQKETVYIAFVPVTELQNYLGVESWKRY